MSGICEPDGTDFVAVIQWESECIPIHIMSDSTTSILIRNITAFIVIYECDYELFSVWSATFVVTEFVFICNTLGIFYIGSSLEVPSEIT